MPKQIKIENKKKQKTVKCTFGFAGGFDLAVAACRSCLRAFDMTGDVVPDDTDDSWPLLEDILSDCKTGGYKKVMYKNTVISCS